MLNLNKSMCGLVKQSKTLDHWNVGSSPAVTNLSVSLGKIFSLNCFTDLSMLGIS